ncbi:MAG: sugar kinase [Deltaproteobacteria bacterium]|nr:MAG: sugar kinase [Deltaproteobacteria bacterium]TMB44227.1 MAG: sugar kinase [Deltaproteobacteria bacterium]
MRVAVIGHVEHVTLGRVPAVPRPGDIAHLESPRSFPGGGGGVAFFQLTRSPAEVLLYTAAGDDDAAAQVLERLSRTGARIFSARRPQAHTRDVVMITPDGERTIVVVGEPLHPQRTDPLPWEALGSCDAAYFTAQDPAALVAARSARLLVVTARRRPALLRSGARADVVVGSALDPREACSLDDFPAGQRPEALVLTEGATGGTVHTARGPQRFPAPPRKPEGGGAYGAGDSFAGALTYFLAVGVPVHEACVRAGPYGAAVLGALDPLEAQLELAA